MKTFLKKLFDCKIAMAAILTALMAALLFAMYNPIFGTNDDYIMSTLIQGGDVHSIFLNVFLVWFNVTAQNLIPNVNMFMILQIANALLAFVVLNYVFMAKFRKKAGVIIAFVFDALFLYMGIIVVQWTHTAAFLCAAGFSLLYYAFFCEQRKGFKIFQIIFSVFLITVGGCYRFIVFEVSLGFFAILCGCLFLEKVLVEKAKQGKLKEALLSGVKSFLGIVISVVVIVGMGFGTRFLSEKMNDSERYREFKTFNSARVGINDYKVAPYEGNEEAYNAIGIKSQNDINTIRRYYYDRDFFTPERLKVMKKLAQEQGLGKQGVKALVVAWLDRFDKVLPFHVSHKVMAILLAVGGCIAAALLFIFRNKIKLLFPILLTICWVIFQYRFTPERDNFPIFALTVVFILSSYFFNRYYFITCAAISAAVFALYEYQYLSRLSYRVTLTFFLPALVYLVLAMDESRLRVWYRDLSVPKKRFAYGVIALFTAATIVMIGYHNYQWKPYTREVKEPNTKIQDYIKAHPSDLYVYNTRLYTAVDMSRERALQISDVPENAIVFADWQTSSYYYDDLLAKHGIEKLFPDMIDDEHRHFVMMRAQIKSLQQFYNEHYAKEGEKIKMVEETEKGFNKYFAVYTVVTEKADQK